MFSKWKLDFFLVEIYKVVKFVFNGFWYVYVEEDDDFKVGLVFLLEDDDGDYGLLVLLEDDDGDDEEGWFFGGGIIEIEK